MIRASLSIAVYYGKYQTNFMDRQDLWRILVHNKLEELRAAYGMDSDAIYRAHRFGVSIYRYVSSRLK